MITPVAVPLGFNWRVGAKPVKGLKILYMLIGLAMVIAGLYAALRLDVYVLLWPGDVVPRPGALNYLGAVVALAGVLLVRAAFRDRPE